MLRKLVLVAAALLLAALTAMELAAAEQINLPVELKGPRPSRSKIWTNDDIELLKRGGRVSFAGAALAPATPPPAEEVAGEEEGEAEEETPKPLTPKEDTPEYWQERLKPLREEMARIDQQIQQLRSGQGKAASNALSLVNDAPGVQVEDTIRRLGQRRTQIQKEIEGVQAEARRRGVPPGWVR